MAAPVYTTRILQVAGAGKTATAVVPAGKRIVIKFMTAYNNSLAAASCFLGVAGVYPFALYLPDANQSKATELQVVAYAGESITLVTGGADTHAVVSGFIFEDAVGPPASTKPIEPERPSPPLPVPVGPIEWPA